MQIVFDRKIAEQLGERYTVLELETITKDGVTLDLFCVVPSEQIAFVPIDDLAAHISLHNQFVAALKHLDYDTVKTLYRSVHGLFGGELNSFYDEVMTRLISQST